MVVGKVPVKDLGLQRHIQSNELGRRNLSIEQSLLKINTASYSLSSSEASN
jgi:hypothetical protein